ncbi:zn 2cys6 transcription factor [Colletotrichum kahawae]|uniref:Zn 2cys6 transcription factor n=1 Tax=Colletotrichum kahawae TaxID=34407 RepID=A0AAE0DC73_COLKA|nr:zn 2cys6 transcription factor [Colletotrichum kahawae]
MAHTRNRRSDASAWAGQPGARDGIQPFNPFCQPAILDDFYLPDTDVPRNPQLSIQYVPNTHTEVEQMLTISRAFNADLPSLPDPKNQGPEFGQSFRSSSDRTPADYLLADAELSIDLLFKGSSFEKKDLGHGAAGPSSHGLARSISQASSHGKDDIESVTFSQGDFAESFGTFNPLNSTTTSLSEYILPSIESSSPTVGQRPLLNVQTNNASPSLNTPGYSGSSSPASAHAFPTSTFNFQTTPTSAPRQSVSALSTGLSSYSHLPSPASPFYDDWSPQFHEDGNASLSQSWSASFASGDFPLFADGPSQPSLVVHPPEAPNMFEQFEDFNIPGPSPTSGIHPIDHTSTNIFTFQNPRTQTLRDMRASVPSNPADNRLAVPRQRPRRSSDCTRPGNPLSSQGRRVHRPAEGKTSRPRSHTTLPPNRSPMIQLQRASQEHIAASSTTTAPVPIRSRSKKPEAAAASYSSTSPKGPVRGRRNGPMEAKSREQAKDTRNKKTVCIRCKHAKQGCIRVDNNPNSPCAQCQKHGCSSKWPGPCVMAHFEDLALSASCNYVSQRAINHLSLDGTRRIHIPLQRGFPLDDIIAALDTARSHFDIRVHQDNRVVYTLNLQKCHEYLLTLKSQIGGGGTDRSLRSFIDRDLVRLDGDWESCMDNVATDDPLALLCAINNMPSRARYSYVYKTHVHLPERFLDPESPSDTGTLLLAAQLARVVCRQVEVKAYTYLQRALYKSTEAKEEVVLPLLRRVGCILASLRWRLAWWTVMLGNPAVARDEDGARAECQERVLELCRRLYFYYCSARRKLATWSTVDSLRGMWSLYPDTDRKVWDAFPGDETEEAFTEWVARGQGLVYESGAPRVLGSMGLPA